GYRRSGLSLEIDAGEAHIVRTIFEYAARGDDKAATAQRLNSLGFKRRNGKPWTHRQVAAVLAQSALYKKGLLRYGRVTGSNQALRLVYEEIASAGSDARKE